MTDEELLLKRFEREDFDPFEGKAFRVRLNDEVDLSLTLDSVEALPPVETSKPNIRKHPFTLLFSGPADKELNDAMYHLTPESGEPVILYLDKKDRDEESNLIRYESVIS